MISNGIPFSTFPIFSGINILSNYPYNSFYNFKKPNSLLNKDLKISSIFSEEISKKNGAQISIIKNSLNYAEETKKLETTNNLFIKSDDINDTLYQNDHKLISANVNTGLNSKLLEPKFNDSMGPGGSTNNPNSKEKIYYINKNNNINGHFFHNIPLISSLFTKIIKIEKKNISPNQIKLINVNKLTQSSEKPTSKIRIPIDDIFSKSTRANEKPFNGKKIKSEKFKFIPENFLIDFYIKEINIQNTSFNSFQESFPTYIDLSDSEKYLENLCKEIKVYNSKNENNLNYDINREYIEFKILYEEEKDKIFLQNKRKISSDDDLFDHNQSNQNSSKLAKNTPLKKYNKTYNKKISKKEKQMKKLKNSINGEYVDVYLNQIQIKKSYLDNFPLIPTLNSNDNIKIHILKGIFEENYELKLKKAKNLVKDNRNLKYIEKKRFELIYQNKKNNAQYIVYINQCNILFIISYYYYQIKKSLLSMNKNFISHQSKSKIFNDRNMAENLIKKYNQIVKSIHN